jgi:hypothetical protein
MSKVDTHRGDVCTHIEGYLQLRDGVVQIMFETLWKRLKKLVENLRRFVELEHHRI